MKNKGFTLVELLAVIVILAIILAIAIPGISGIIENARIKAFENDTKLIIKQINNKRSIDSNFNANDLNVDNMAEELEIDNANYQSLSVSVNNDKVYLNVVGKNKWDGLEIYGPTDSLLLIEAGTYALAPESCFTFDSATKTINHYDLNNPSCPNNPQIPDTIGSVAVENIGPGSFITPTEQWCDGIQVDVNYIRGEDVEYCYYEVDWDNPGPITAVKLPKYLKTIGYGAFMHNRITDLIIQNNVTTIETTAFSDNYSITSVTIPNSVLTIGSFTFSYNKITSITISDSVTFIDVGAFANNELTDVFIPANVTYIGQASFRGNPTLNTLIVDNNNPNYKSVNNAIYSKDGTTLVAGTKGMSNNIENTTISIEQNAFYQMGLTSVTIPSSVTNIGSSAFLGNELSSITIPVNVTNIGGQALYLNKLTSITMEREGIDIGNYLLTWKNNNFRDAYQAGGAGTYTGTQEGTWSK